MTSGSRSFLVTCNGKMQIDHSTQIHPFVETKTSLEGSPKLSPNISGTQNGGTTTFRRGKIHITFKGLFLKSRMRFEMFYYHMLMKTYIWMFFYNRGGVNISPTSSHLFIGFFHYFHHPFWGTTIFGNTHVLLMF